MSDRKTAPKGLQSLVFRLTREKRDAVHELARRTRVRHGELLRMAIEDVLRKHGEVVR